MGAVQPQALAIAFVKSVLAKKEAVFDTLSRIALGSLIGLYQVTDFRYTQCRYMLYRKQATPFIRMSIGPQWFQAPEMDTVRLLIFQ